MSRFSGLPDALRSSSEATTSTPNPDDGSAPESIIEEEEDTAMSDTENKAALEAARAEGHAAGFQAATARLAAVSASEHFTGREASAVKLLTMGSLANASAEDIGSILADQPKTETNALSADDQRQAAEEGGRREMREAISQGQNSSIDASSGVAGSSNAKADPNAPWAKALAKSFGSKVA